MIINKTKKKVLAEKHVIYLGMMQAKGLMFSKKKAAVFPLTHPRRISVHTNFVFFPIDVFFLDSNLKVIEKVLNLKPFSYHKTKVKFNYMVELPSPAGKGVSLGDIISFRR